MWQSTPIQTQPVNCAFNDDILRFVWVTDSHTRNNDVALLRTNMDKAIADCNDWRPDFFVHTGDLADNTPVRVLGNFYQMMACRRPVMVAIGNHDEYEAVLGSPQTAAIEGFNGFNQTAPFWHTRTWTTQNGGTTFRLIFLDFNFYAVDPNGIKISPAHQAGDRVGYSTSEPSGGWMRQLGQRQRDWVAATLAADRSSDAVLVFHHYRLRTNAVVDAIEMIDVFQADGRPTLGFHGHDHNNAYMLEQNSSDGRYTWQSYKCPALLESGSWTRASLHIAAGAIVIDALDIYNYTNPGTWTIDAPFVVI